MELNEFMHRFLPDLEQKYIVDFLKMRNGEEPNFIFDNFPEALQNLIDKICEKQRDNCCRAFGHSREKYNDFENEGIGDSTYEIENAEQPKIDQI